MTTLIVLFNLKSGVTAADYENWARATDIPTAGALPSVDCFEVLRSLSVLGSDAAPPYQYVERLEINDMGQLGQDISTAAMQKVSAQFQAFADNPLFIVTEKI
jgi:hypothetical protein